MKTPERHYELTTMEHSACERVWDRPQEEVSAQRWKRKNRVKQLKHTIQKYKDGTMLPEVRPLRDAYKWLQKLQKPKEDAPIISWLNYKSAIKIIQIQIINAFEDAVICLGKAIEKKNRKKGARK